MESVYPETHWNPDKTLNIRSETDIPMAIEKKFLFLWVWGRSFSELDPLLKIKNK
ncbi:MAG: hypothetical protein WBO36_02500 [Saprospiraceae bacterium]